MDSEAGFFAGIKGNPPKFIKLLKIDSHEDIDLLHPIIRVIVPEVEKIGWSIVITSPT